MTPEELLKLKDDLIVKNPDLQEIMKQFGIDEEVYTQSLAELLGMYQYIPPSTSNSTSV